MTPHQQPCVKLDTADLHALTIKCLVAIIQANLGEPHLFRYGFGLARIRATSRGIMVEPLNPDRLRNELARLIKWLAPLHDKDGEVARWKKAKPPLDVVTNVLAEPDWPLPRVIRVVPCPVFGRDGRIRSERGYDPNTGTYYSPPAGFVLPPVSEDPTPSKIEEAVRLIRQDLLGDFPWVSSADFANTMAMLLLPFVRDMFDGPTPMHVVDAPTPGTGKTLLVRLVGIVVLGREPGMETQGGSSDEWRKKIGASLSKGSALVVIDNLRGRIDSSHLASVLTTTEWGDRRLGHNDETIEFPNRALWVGTANNPTFSPELTRRIVPIRLDARVEQPASRDPASFKHRDLAGWLDQNRSEVVAAILTLVQAWVAVGRPLGDRTMGSFENWAGVVGGILQVAGIDGFLENLDDFRGRADTETEQKRVFINRWAERHGELPVSTSDLLSLLGDLPDFLELGDGSERSRATTLGLRLVEMDRQVHSGYRIEKARDRGGANQWRLRREVG
ncbi:MAG: hypothetical protein QY307_02730 [Acidimicrobiia bacterium]|nr:MAG: hypothetical protein QY307_02730 [Acidimicrobiia bacterium]